MRTEGVELIAVCDIDPAKAKAAAEALGVSHGTSDPNVLFETDRLDFVDIVTRMETHHDVWCLARQMAHRAHEGTGKIEDGTPRPEKPTT